MTAPRFDCVLFDRGHVFCFTGIGARKDSARFWAHGFTALNLAPARSLMIGDTLGQDVVASSKRPDPHVARQ